MKIYELTETISVKEWNSFSLPQLMDNLVHSPSGIMFVKNAPEEAQMYAVMRRPSLVATIQKPTDKVIMTALSSSTWFLSKDDYSRYIEVVNDIFETNELLRKKWLRYGEREFGKGWSSR